MIIHGDLFDVLPTLDAASVDSCVTDPPYELAFMGKAWDRSGVTNNPATWAAILRVLKPGAHLVAFGGTRTSHRSGFPKSRNLGKGWGTALKPGHEPIVLARKPFKGSITANHERLKVGGLNVDGCRIDATESTIRVSNAGTNGDGWGMGANSHVNGSDLGRWPANVLLDEPAAELLDAQSGELAGRVGMTQHASGTNRVYGTFARTEQSLLIDGVADTGGASRFFYVAKPSREERDLGCEFLPRVSAATITGRKEGSAGLQNPRAGIRAGSMDRDTLERAARNIHPTVKPLALMRWLVRLVTPQGGTVLDPFGGSGTTAMACAAEGLDFVLIEREAEYIPIIEARVRSIAPLFLNNSSEAATALGAVDPVAGGSTE